MLVLVTGATGFLGRRVVQELLNQHHQVRCLVHTPGRERIFSDRSLDVYYGSVSDPASLTVAFHNVDAAVHLVAIIRQGKRATFQQVNHRGTANVVGAAREAGVKHLIHVSAIGSTSNPSYAYLYSKWQGEQEIIRSGLPYTICRPSIMFGEGDEFINALAALVKVSPLVPVIGSGRNRLQPVAVQDVARCIALAAGRDDLKGKTIELGGPQQLSYNEIVAIIARTLGKRRLRIHISLWLVYVATALLQKVHPRPPITTEQLRMLTIRNVAELGIIEETFGFTPRPLEGNIDFINAIGYGDGLKMSLGFMRSHVRDH